MHTIRNKQGDSTDTDFWNQWSSVTPRMAMFVKIQPKSFWNVSAIGFTSNSRDMTLPGHQGVTFYSAAGITPTVIEQALENPTNLEIQGLYQSGLFQQSDVVRGKWDFASVEIFSACWDNVNLGELLTFKGNLGEIKDYDIYFKTEARGLMARLSSDASMLTSKYCRVKEFQDSECGHTATTVVVGGTTYALSALVTATYASSSRRDFIFDGPNNFTSIPSGYTLPPTDFFNNGTLTASDSDNAGVTREILKYEKLSASSYSISLKRSFPYDFPTNGYPVFTLKAGCNRTVEDCKKYGNIINFRGEPYVPGMETLNRIPASQ